MTTYKHRMLAANSTELANLWEWSNQYKGAPGYIGCDLQIKRRQAAIDAELALLDGKWTVRDRFAFPTKEKLAYFKLKWG